MFDTNEKIHNKRIKRYYELLPFFKKVYSISLNRKQTIQELINDIIYKNYFRSIKSLDFIILKLILFSNRKKINWNVEFRYITDYILEKNRLILEETQNVYLPNRFKSSYFFNTVEDCLKYYKSFPDQLIICYLIKCEIIE